MASSNRSSPDERVGNICRAISGEEYETTMTSKKGSILEGLLPDVSSPSSSFKWPLARRRADEGVVDELSKSHGSTSGARKWISDLSPLANLVVSRCSQKLDASMDELQRSFDAEASESIKQPASYARNFLEYCCFRTLALSTRDTGHLADKSFRLLAYDMMLAWEAPSAASQPTLKVGGERTVGFEAFSRIAPALPTVADVVTCSHIFDILTESSGGRLTFAAYEKYLVALDKTIKKTKMQFTSPLLSSFRSHRGERILEIDGTLISHPVLEHVGTSTWPGRLTLTDHAVYFEPHRVMGYDDAKVYDLADDLKQIIRPEWTGPWGSRLFDKAVMYQSISLSEPVIIDFPEFNGHSRRDYWLSIMREILYCHRFIREFQIEDVEKEEVISKSVLGILRLQTIQELFPSISVKYETLLTFNLCEQLYGGHLIIKTLASTICSRRFDRTNQSDSGREMYAISSLVVLSNLGIKSHSTDQWLFAGDIVVGVVTPLEIVVRDSKKNYIKVEEAKATIDRVKVDGLRTNLAVMKGLLQPLMDIGSHLFSLASWDEPLKSLMFCCTSCYIIIRGWMAYAFAISLLSTTIFMLIARFTNQQRPINQIKVKEPPPMSTMEQLMAVQSAISQFEELVQDGNIVLLKLRALLLAVPSQSTDRAILALILMALAIAFLPVKLTVLIIFLEIFTRNSPPRRPSTERSTRRLREWWFSIPGAPVALERKIKDDKKKR